MDSFVTINLDSDFCDICNQDTGEELVDFVVNDQCLIGLENTEAFKRAHKDCIRKWESVIKSTLKHRCPSPKRSWKDKFKDLLHGNSEETVLQDAWLAIDTNKNEEKRTDILDDEKFNNTRNKWANCQQEGEKKNEFLVKESYHIERAHHDIDGCEERARKLRVRSVDLEDGGSCCIDSHDRKHDQDHIAEVLRKHWTTETLRSLEKDKVQEVYGIFKDKIKETSAVLINVLQERDALSQQADSLQETAGKLVQMQQKQNIKSLRLDLEHTIYHSTPKIV